MAINTKKRAFIQLVSGLALLIACPFNLLAQDVTDRGNEASTQTSRPLRWDFVPDEVIRAKTLVNHTTETDRIQRTDSIYEYRWLVEEVDSDGTATLLLQFDRIRFRYQSDETVFDFDSLTDRSTDIEHDVPAVSSQFTRSQRWLGSEYRIKVTARGEVQDVARSDSDSGSAPRALTPAFWPTLPDTRVSVGDSWLKQSNDDASTRYRLAKVEQVVDRVIYHIVTDGEVSHFDAKAGKFIDHAKKFGYQFEDSPGKLATTSFDIRQRLFTEDRPGQGLKFAPAQVSQPSEAWHYLQLSSRFASQIQEHLMNERGGLRAIINRMVFEIVPPEDLNEPSADWRADQWMVAAQVHERSGDREKAKWALHEAMARAESMNDDFLTASLQAKIAEGLARIGDGRGAVQAAMGIDRSAGTVGAHITAQGPVDIPEASLQSFALLLVASSQAQSAAYEQCSTTIEMIADRNTKSAAYWLLAMRQSEQGDLAAALETAKLADKDGPEQREFWQQPPPLVLELTTKGPRPVQLNAFRTLALSSIASSQASSGDDVGAAESLKQINIPILRDAATMELIVSLSEKGESADAWIDRIVNSDFRSMARYHKAMHHLRIGDFEGVKQLADSIESSAIRANLRLDFCNRLADSGDKPELARQISLAQQTIESIGEPVAKANALWKLALAQTRADESQAAIENLRVAQRLIDDSLEDASARAGALADIAVALHSAGAKDEAESVMNLVLEEASKLDEYTQPAAELAIVHKQLQMGLLEPAETLARSIASAAERCQALAAVAQRYAELLELGKSRKLFVDAFGSAQEVEDILGLDTQYSKGGAIRQTARHQAACDLDGLIEYVTNAESPNVKAYGFLGAAEVLAPDALQRAEARGSQFPHGLLHELWSPRLIAKVVQSN